MGILEDANERYQAIYTKKITCPEHGTVKHKATLYLHGHKYAGIWECDVDKTSDSCEHESSHVETTETDPLYPDGPVYDTKVYVCDVCECDIEGSPEEDEADMFAEMSLDCSD
jgi:hypothetical protein